MCENMNTVFLGGVYNILLHEIRVDLVLKDEWFNFAEG